MAIVMMGVRVHELSEAVYASMENTVVETLWDMTGVVSPYVLRVVIGEAEIEDMFHVRRSSDMWLEAVVFCSEEEKWAYERGEMRVPVMKLRGPQEFMSMD